MREPSGRMEDTRWLKGSFSWAFHVKYNKGKRSGHKEIRQFLTDRDRECVSSWTNIAN